MVHSKKNKCMLFHNKSTHFYFNCLQWNPPNDKYLGNLTWVKLAYHDTGCSPEGYIFYTLKYIKLDMQSARFPVKLFSITCGECHEYEGSPLICWKDVDSYIVMVTFKTM